MTDRELCPECGSPITYGACAMCRRRHDRVLETLLAIKQAYDVLAAAPPNCYPETRA